MIYLVDINGDNWISDLKVHDTQQDYVPDSTAILARAYAYRDDRSRAFYIYNNETPVGMGLYCDYPELESYELNQLFIDRHYQGRGYGTAAVKKILNAMRQDGKYQKAVLWYVEGNEAAKKLYARLGFDETGRIHDEIGMERML